MIDTFQKLLPWLTNLSFFPKIFVTLLIVASTGFLLSLIWSKPVDSTNSNKVPTEVTSEIANSQEEQKQNEDSEQSKNEHSDITEKLNNISKKNADLLLEVAKKGKFGIYADELAGNLGVSRDEAVYRAKDLAKSDLVVVLPLTDLNIRLSEELIRLSGNSPTSYLETQFK